MGIGCKIGWHDWSKWTKYDEYVNPPRALYTAQGLCVSYQGIALDFVSRYCVRCSKTQTGECRRGSSHVHITEYE